MDTFILAGAWTVAGVAVLAALLTVVPRLGAPGMMWSGRVARAPLLDPVVAALTWLPWLIAAIVGGWIGVSGALAGQVVVMLGWIVVHELIHRRAARGPRLVNFIHRTVGRWRNHLCLWVTVIVLPVFWLVRLAEVLFYPMLVWLLRFPRYRQAEWINVSRHKFEGLVGHDLIWCLYCDWMTGVYALGGEMLRNVESFWCPIRFHDGKKCEHCRVDFPDIDGGWVAPGGTMADVERTMERMYGQENDQFARPRAWFGHPARLTVDGADPKADRPAS
jgi:hypothetical protein